MRAFLLSLVAVVAVLFPNRGTAQVYPLRTAAPAVTAAAADWQIRSEPIMVDSLVYLPTHEMRLFDGQVMVKVGVYQHVPVYADATLEPHSIVYIPVGRDRMRRYERRRDRELAGTTGSRTPTFPVESAAATPAEERIVGTAGSVVSNVAGASTASVPRPRRVVIESIPRPRANHMDGVWLEFEGVRWYSAGASTSYLADRFTRIGDYRGFAVYRETAGKPDVIWVQVVGGGPLAPYQKR